MHFVSFAKALSRWAWMKKSHTLKLTLTLTLSLAKWKWKRIPKDLCILFDPLLCLLHECVHIHHDLHLTVIGGACKVPQCNVSQEPLPQIQPMLIDHLIRVCDKLMSPPSALPDNGSQGKTALLVENDPRLSQSLQCLLEGCGYRVLPAASGMEAITKFQAHRGDLHLLLSEAVIDRLDGFELAARMRQVHPASIVLLMAGSALAHLPQCCFAHECLRKPFSDSELLGAVWRHSNGAGA